MGIATISYAVGIGGYHDMSALVSFFTTGYYRQRPGAMWCRWEPNAYGKWVFVRSNLDRIAGDRAVLDAMARRKLDDLDAPIADLAPRLGPEGRADLDLIDGFNHVEDGAGFLGRLQFWHAVYRLLEMRDAEAEP